MRQIRNAPTTVQNVVTYDAVIDVDNPELKLKPGMTANVTFIYAEKNDVLRVPNAALRFRPPADLAKSAASLAAARASGPASSGPDTWPPRPERRRRAVVASARAVVARGRRRAAGGGSAGQAADGESSRRHSTVWVLDGNRPAPGAHQGRASPTAHSPSRRGRAQGGRRAGHRSDRRGRRAEGHDRAPPGGARAGGGGLRRASERPP